MPKKRKRLNLLLPNSSENIIPNSPLSTLKRKLPISDVELFPDISRKAYHILPSLNDRRIKSTANSFAILENDEHKKYKIKTNIIEKKHKSANDSKEIKNDDN